MECLAAFVLFFAGLPEQEPSVKLLDLGRFPFCVEVCADNVRFNRLVYEATFKEYRALHFNPARCLFLEQSMEELEWQYRCWESLWNARDMELSESLRLTWLYRLYKEIGPLAYHVGAMPEHVNPELFRWR